MFRVVQRIYPVLSGCWACRLLCGYGIWDKFVVRGFARQAVKAQKLTNMCVFDWKEWMDPSLRQITLHSFQRAFLITKQEDEPVLFFKKNLMQHDWCGLRKAPEQGLKILKDPSTSHSEIN